jgi:hypothetical protein
VDGSTILQLKLEPQFSGAMYRTDFYPRWMYGKQANEARTTERMAMVKPTASALLLAVATFALAGCWTAPVTTVHPRATLDCQSAIPVVAVKHGATVRSVDADQRLMVLNRWHHRDGQGGPE